MNYSTFEADILRALYQEHVFDKRSEMVPFSEILLSYELHSQQGWLLAAQRSLQSVGLIEGPSRSTNDQMAAGRITGAGMKKIEGEFAAKDGRVPVMLPKLGVEYDMFPADMEAAHDSRLWTGLPNDFVLDDRRRAEIVRALDVAESGLSTSISSQHDQAQARAYLVAARAMLEAPEPETDLAWEIISRANNIAGIAALFVSVLSLFMAK